MNGLIVEAIDATGVANDGLFDAFDVCDLNAYLPAEHYEEWVLLHGDDSDVEETGFHLVQNDGANTRCSAARTPSTRWPTASIIWVSTLSAAAS